MPEPRSSVNACATSADAVLAASIFHFGTYTVSDVKHYLAQHGVPVRLPETVAG